MLLELINHNEDLLKLQNEGYEVDFSNGYLMIHHIPYVNKNNEVAYGTLVSKSQLSGNILQPVNHTALWIGDFPCNSMGKPMIQLSESKVQEKIKDGLTTNFQFSQKPKPEGVYKDHHHKMTQYIKMLENEAHVIDPNAKAITFRPTKLSKEESVFCYMDTATSRAGITSINEKLKQHKIAIVGLGGTGSYILDLVAKTHVEEIHLFDGDDFYNHNAFRSPGAFSFDDLVENMSKVEQLTRIYSRMRRNIVPHPYFIDDSNIAELCTADFVFLCVDKGEPRKLIINYLVENKIPFIDVGISILNENEALTGSVRTTTCTPSTNNHIEKRIPFGSNNENDYSSNIQIVDMNALNAAFAVIKWKKMCGFYHDIPNEHHTVYGISTNTVTNDVVKNES